MKKHSFLLLLTVFTVTIVKPSFSQDFWEILATPDTASASTLTFNSNDDIFMGSNGVYLSHDNGETWEYKGLFGHTIYSMAIDSMGNVFAGSSYKIYKSLNYGDTWSLAYTGGENILTLACERNGLIFAGTGADIGILRSNNYGVNWDTVFIAPGIFEYVFDLAITTGEIVYAGTTAFVGNGGGVYQSVDNGNTWTHIGLYEQEINALGLNSSDILYAGSVGLNWGIYQKDPLSNDWYLLFANGTVTGIAINSKDWIYIGCSFEVFIGGVYFSNDFGNTWAAINSGLVQNDIDHLYISHDQYVFAVDRDRGILYRSVQPTVFFKYSPEEAKIVVYPNPCKNLIFFDLTGINPHSVTLNIYNTQGQPVFNYNRQINPSSKFTINMADWPSGFYCYVIENEFNIYWGKVIKIN